MKTTSLTSDPSKISAPAARLAIGAAVASLVFLASLHVLSPEYSPAWRLMSEYANGDYPWVLSLMFVAWGLSSWALAYAIKSQLVGKAGKVGLGFLIAAGLGQAAASVFDIHHPLHEPSAMFGILCLPIAALIISKQLGRTQPWSAFKGTLRTVSHLPWITALAMAVTFVLLIVTYMQSGADPNAGSEITTLPDGVIAVVGYPNRLLPVMYGLWVSTVAWHALKLRRQRS